jgi:PTS system mannose-specific IIB component
MICDVRIDDRLIHGQVTGYWIPQYSITKVVIVDDDIVHDSMRKNALRFGCPEKVSLSFHSAAKTAEILKKGGDSGSNVMLLCTNPKPILDMVEAGYPIQQVTVGNISPHNDTDVHIKGTTYVNQQDIACLKKLHEKGVKIILQMAPKDSPEDLSEFIEKQN